MKTLIVAPHSDDEVLGCSVWMQRHECDVVVMAIGDYQRYDKQTSDPQGRMQEMLNAHGFLKVNNSHVLTNLDGKLDTISQSYLVQKIDEILMNGYEAVLYPYPSRHIDHIVTNQVVNACLRLRSGKQMERYALMYEYPFINTMDFFGGGVYLQATKAEMDKKVQAFNLHKSQIKELPSPLNPEGIYTLAKMRGMECGSQYAEKYYLNHIIL